MPSGSRMPRVLVALLHDTLTFAFTAAFTWTHIFGYMFLTRALGTPPTFSGGCGAPDSASVPWPFQYLLLGLPALCIFFLYNCGPFVRSAGALLSVSTMYVTPLLLRLPPVSFGPEAFLLHTLMYAGGHSLCTFVYGWMPEEIIDMLREQPAALSREEDDILGAS